MSRIGKHPVPVPSGVQVNLSGQSLNAKGPKGQLSVTLAEDVAVSMQDGKILVLPRDKASRRGKMLWGMSRTLVSNMVKGVAEGFKVDLEINGVGYRAAIQGKNLVLQLGFSHEVTYPIPEGIDIKVEKQTAVSISGADKQKVGQIAAEIRSYRSPEPYKGKGIKYADERILRKEGKKK